MATVTQGLKVLNPNPQAYTFEITSADTDITLTINITKVVTVSCLKAALNALALHFSGRGELTP